MIKTSKTDQFGKVHVLQNSLDDGGLRVAGVGSLSCSKSSQD